METDTIDDAACAASDLTARLHGELAQAQTQLALAIARGFRCGASTDAAAAAAAERMLAEQRLAMLHELLDGMPDITFQPPEGEGAHRASA